MPNRILKESICCSENIDQLSPFQETFFYRLIVNCDDYGRMDARPKVLSSRLFPLKDIKQSQIIDALKALSSAELIILYEKDGHQFIQMKTWDHHQTIRAKKSKYPALDDGCVQLQANDFRCKQMNSDESKCPRNPIQSNPIRIQSESESNPNLSTQRTSALDTDTDFNAFWSEYPKKVKKPDAVKAWKKLPPSVRPSDVIDGVKRWKKSEQWTRDGGRFIPNPATWLNNQQWNDDVPAAAAAKNNACDVHGYEQRDYSNAQQEAIARMMSDEEW